MPEQAEIMEWRGCEVVDRDGDKVGKLDEVYLDRQTGQPEWAIVNTGLFGRKSSFVPLKDALREGEMIRVPYEKEQIKEAPSVDPDGEISQEEEQSVYAHYGLDYSETQSSSGLPEGETAAAAAGGPGSGTSATTGTEPGTTGTEPGSATTGNEPGTSATTGNEAGTSAATGNVPGPPAGGASGGTAASDDDATSGTAGTAATSGSASGSPRKGLRLQRMVQEEVRLAPDSDEVVESRSVEETRLAPDDDG